MKEDGYRSLHGAGKTEAGEGEGGNGERKDLGNFGPDLPVLGRVCSGSPVFPSCSPSFSVYKSRLLCVPPLSLIQARRKPKSRRPSTNRTCSIIWPNLPCLMTRKKGISLNSRGRTTAISEKTVRPSSSSDSVFSCYPGWLLFLSCNEPSVRYVPSTPSLPFSIVPSLPPFFLPSLLPLNQGSSLTWANANDAPP